MSKIKEAIKWCSAYGAPKLSTEAAAELAELKSRVERLEYLAKEMSEEFGAWMEVYGNDEGSRNILAEYEKLKGDQ